MPRIVIDLDRDLPPRAARLTGKALASVFGGCSNGGGPCGMLSYCCPGFVCKKWPMSSIGTCAQA
jgi:hypothetical protein